jgi:hypothetical protein
MRSLFMIVAVITAGFAAAASRLGRNIMRFRER